MAQRTIIEILSDVSGQPAERTVTLGIEGQHYEIDLTAEEVEELFSSVQEYVDHARTTGPRKGSTFRPVRTETPVSATAVRAWAASNGIPVNAKGRIPYAITEQFKAANAPRTA